MDWLTYWLVSVNGFRLGDVYKRQVFQNVRLLSTLKQRLQEVGFTVFEHKFVPANDAGLALGQAVIGAQHFSGLS